GGFRNINAAHLLGVRLFLVPHDEPILRGERRWQGVFGDTLRVVMDLSNIDEDTYSSTGQPIRLAWPKNEVIPRTVECMLENAKREKNDVRFLDVSIRGQDGFADLARVYRLDEEFPDVLRSRNRRPRND
ncbi:MAG: hypothetical protein KC591_11270, partial [Gemmatimonadetes bacterium]|nr:hypothetical protein [Gemmatimonadota bacterium]